MGKVLIEASGDVAVVRLNNGPTNAVNLELVETFLKESIRSAMRRS